MGNKKKRKRRDRLTRRERKLCLAASLNLVAISFLPDTKLGPAAMSWVYVQTKAWGIEPEEIEAIQQPLFDSGEIQSATAMFEAAGILDEPEAAPTAEEKRN
jgi:LPS sulfotransferase NodH